MEHLYNKYLNEHRITSNEMSLDKYIEMKKGQTRAAMTEMRYLLAFAGSLLVLSAPFQDDDKKFYKHYWATRRLYTMLKRAELICLAAVNPADFIELVRNPMPISSTLTDAAAAMKDSSDEIESILTGQQRKSKHFYGYKELDYLFPGWQQLKKFTELDDNSTSEK